LNEKCEEKDARTCRVWYLPPEGWKSITCKIIEGNVVFTKENWKNKDWQAVISKDYKKDVEKKSPHIFLSRAPLTFGHSQLVLPPPPCKSKNEKIPETIFFEFASYIVKRALAAFEKVLGKKEVHQNPTFKHLAESTYSYGKYIKTLVVRASASEKVGSEYKIHLVPYFQSHETECLKRFRAQHKVPPNKKGGLLGWLGERETEIDKWEVEWCSPDFSLDDVARDVWKLPQLAQELSKSWPG